MNDLMRNAVEQSARYVPESMQREYADRVAAIGARYHGLDRDVFYNAAWWKEARRTLLDTIFYLSIQIDGHKGSKANMALKTARRYVADALDLIEKVQPKERTK